MILKFKNSGQFKKRSIPHNKGKKTGFNQKQSTSLKKLYADGVLKPNSTSFKKGQKPWNVGKTGIYTEEQIQNLKEKRLHRVFPKKDSKIEKILQEGLKKRKIPFTTHVPIIGQPDILIEPSICVFADSDWFHGFTYMSGHDCSKYKMLNNEYFEKKIQSDKEKTQSLTEQGYKVLRFWEHEIMKNPEKCFQKIIKIIKKSTISHKKST